MFKLISNERDANENNEGTSFTFQKLKAVGKAPP